MQLQLVAEDSSSYVTSGASGGGPGTSTSGANDTGGSGSGSTGSNGGGSGGSGSGVVTSGGGGTTITTGSGSRYDIAFYLPGQIAGSYDWRFTADSAPPTLPANLIGSSLSAEAAPTGDVSIPIYQIPGGTGTRTQVGSLNFAAGSKTGTYIFGAQVALAQGDVLQIDPSGVTDSTLSGVSGILAATN